MELKELKNSWNLLDERLKKEEYNRSKMLDTILKKERKSAYNKLVNYEFISAILCIFFIPLVILNSHLLNSRVQGAPISETLYVILGLSFIWQAFKITWLLRKDFLKQTVIQSHREITRYKKWIQIEFITGIAMVFFLIFPITYLRNIHNTWFYLYAAFVLIFVLSLSTALYLRLQMKNIREIQENLKEAKEFEQEE